MKRVLFFLSAFLPLSLIAEDIELYVGDTSLSDKDRPKVLILFDTSGSMGGEVEVRNPYNPSENYNALSGDTAASSDIFYVKGEVDEKPQPGTDNRRFVDAINSCNTARNKLATVGYYIGYVREYTFVGESGSWKELPELDGSTIKTVECWDDVRLEDNVNAYHKNNDGTFSAIGAGYPVDGLGNTSSPERFVDDVASSNTNLGAGEIVTLYTANYLRWSLGDLNDPKIGTDDIQKLIIAQDAITELVDAAPTVDFALGAFNRNSNNTDRHGGRIVYGFRENFGVTEVDDYKDMVDSLTANGATPLCETLYEAYKYLSGSAVFYGDNDPNRAPARDTSVEDGNKVYISPYDTCSNNISVILMTDGIPVRDSEANSLVTALTGDSNDSDYYNSYLTNLARWMHTNDINGNPADGDQTIDLFTVGFALEDEDAVNLLIESAAAGGGRFLDATDPSDLLSQLQSAIVTILQKDSTFTAPSVASNNFDRTETLDSVYYAMFTPDKGPRWQGNLKKLKIRESGLVGKDLQSAINPEGNITSTATTFWTNDDAPDGNDVSQGGVVEMFRNMDPADRVIYSDIGSSGLDELTLAKATSGNTNAFASLEALASAMGVETSEVQDYLDWAKGYDKDNADGDANNDTTDMRPDVFGDPLHSKPLVINYGTSEEDQDLRIIIGTNAGALHMFNDDVDNSESGTADTITEKWAFMPKEFFSQIRTLRDNFTSSDKVYGIDGTPVSLIVDANGNGKIETGTDTAMVFFGLRRGGSSYYALDVTDPDNPVLKWHIDSSDSAFSQIKQSWSTPRIAYSRANMSGSTPKPVLFFAAGYDPAKDTQGSVGTDDSNGLGVFMVDALSGDLIWSLTPDANGGGKTWPGTDSIASAIATLDSDSDGFTDRLYVGDTGGNLWRVDMPTATTDVWAAHKVAYVGGTTHETDRRFFAEPTIARAVITETFTEEVEVEGVLTTKTFKVEKPYDAILIGSGDRTNPLDTLTNDAIFMIKDENILTQQFTTAPAVINIDDLYDLTLDPFGNLDKEASDYEEQFNVEAVKLSEKKGWYIDLAQSEGEKNVARPEAFAGVAYYNTFAPPADSANTCEISSVGTGYLYAVDLSFGTQIYDKRILETTSALSDGVTIVTTEENLTEEELEELGSNRVKGSTTRILAGDALKLCDATGDCTGIKLKTMRNSMVVDEGQANGN
ncbi:pilus assembly protein [Thalassotalea euphylliae]|uniref:pilus assembly protein n=1 Tax=Thalassotalea euphylliae TaxID=1655234 RepID=UPI0036301B8D